MDNRRPNAQICITGDPDILERETPSVASHSSRGHAVKLRLKQWYWLQVQLHLTSNANPTRRHFELSNRPFIYLNQPQPQLFAHVQEPHSTQGWVMLLPSKRGPRLHLQITLTR
ncbi:MAG: hypothetical protein Ct9H300mP13_1400 [Gammaproteobacteria bacterium]|nr:MAG: hypothetical protein Ct9H300mP13_1400 [Gammaproteobacteria bacterium]